jgi:hypothetical protein
VGEGCSAVLSPSTTLFNACPAGSGGPNGSLRIGPPLVRTQDGSPLTSGKPAAIVVQAPGLQSLKVFVAGDAQHPSWVSLGPTGLISNTWWVGTNLVLPSTAGLQAVRVTYSDSTSVGPGSCGGLDNYDLVFRVQ